MKLLKLFFLFPFIACANSSVPNILTAIALLICAMPAYAEDWSGTEWEVVQEGKCYPSTEVFMKSVFGDNYPEDENIKLGEWHGEYNIAGDQTPSRGWSSYIIQKKKMNKVCIIAYLPSEGGSVTGNFSATGTLLELKTSEYLYPMLPNAPHTLKIIYRPNKQGRFFPSECTVIGEHENKRKVDCIKGDVQSIPVRIPPSFDCSNFSKLNDPEYLICSNGNFTELDVVLEKNYKAFLSANIGELRSQLIKDQRTWLNRRNECKGGLVQYVGLC